MKKLVRVKTGSKLFGVCTGISRYLDIDVTVIRLLTIFLALYSFGTMFLAYIIAAFIIPEDDGFMDI